MRIVFLRHARAQSNLDSTRVAGRSHEAPLTPEGLEHAATLGQEVAGLTFAEVHASTCRRTLETATPVAAALGLALQPTDLLVERSHGTFEGQLKSEVYTDEVVADIHRDQWRWAPPEGETLEQVGTRVMDWIRGLDDSPDPVLAVSHLMVMWSVFRLCTGCDHRILPKLKVVNGAVIEIEVTDAAAAGHGLQLLRWNAALSDTET